MGGSLYSEWQSKEERRMLLIPNHSGCCSESRFFFMDCEPASSVFLGRTETSILWTWIDYINTSARIINAHAISRSPGSHRCHRQAALLL